MAGQWWLAYGGWCMVNQQLVACGLWLVAGGWWLVAGGWWLVAGVWCMVAGGWWLVAGMGAGIQKVVLVGVGGGGGGLASCPGPRWSCDPRQQPLAAGISARRRKRLRLERRSGAVRVEVSCPN